MVICFLAPADNYHTKKWCEYFVSKKHEVHVISFANDNIKQVYVHYINSGVKTNNSDLKKLKYILSITKIKKIIKNIKPDIINAHYATSYGLVATLCGYDNYILSLWGSDIYRFPNKSFFHKKVLQYILKKAPHIFSTSYAMATEAKKYVKNKDFFITPFGVKTNLFIPNKRKTNKDKFCIGIVKGLKYEYGIDTLLHAIYIVKKENPNLNIELKIAGKGDKEIDYKNLAIELGINKYISWLGFVSQEMAAKIWASLDLAVIPSRYESFGVSALEAQSCEVPLIISDVAGLKEATVPSKSSYVVPIDNSKELAAAIIYLYKNEKLRISMGKYGRKYVIDNFEYEKCFELIEKKFEELNCNKG